MAMQKKLSITKNVSGDEQESSFMNACLSNMGTLSVSIAIRPPRMEQGNQDSIAAKLEEDLKPLTDLGYEVEIQIGKDEEDEVNTNCLSGLRCPKCLSLEPLLIETTGLDPEGKEMMGSSALLSCDEEPIKYIAKWYDEGSDETVGDTEWSEESTCECCNCGREGTISDFAVNFQDAELSEQNIAFDHRNRFIVSQEQYNAAYILYLKRLEQTSAGAPEVKPNQRLVDVRSSELSVVLHHAKINGASLNTVSENEIAFSEYVESYICLEQLKQALKKYKFWCTSNNCKPKVDRVTSIDELSQSDISHILYHAELEGFKLLPLRIN